MSLRLTEVLSAEYLRSTINENTPVEQIVENLFQKGMELYGIIEPREYDYWDDFKQAHAAGNSELAQLEGPSFIDEADLVALNRCPLADVIANLNNDSKRSALHQRIIDVYMAQNPGCDGIVHPVCIAHQVARQLVVASLDVAEKTTLHCHQLACRRAPSMKITYDHNGLSTVGMSERQTARRVSGSACLYALVGD